MALAWMLSRDYFSSSVRPGCPTGKVCGLLQLLSAWHEQYVVQEIPWSQQLHFVDLYDLSDVHLHEIACSRSLGATTLIPYTDVGGMLLPLVFNPYFEMSVLGALSLLATFQSMLGHLQIWCVLLMFHPWSASGRNFSFGVLAWELNSLPLPHPLYWLIDICTSVLIDWFVFLWW